MKAIAALQEGWPGNGRSWDKASITIVLGKSAGGDQEVKKTTDVRWNDELLYRWKVFRYILERLNVSLVPKGCPREWLLSLCWKLFQLPSEEGSLAWDRFAQAPCDLIPWAIEHHELSLDRTHCLISVEAAQVYAQEQHWVEQGFFPS